MKVRILLNGAPYDISDHPVGSISGVRINGVPIPDQPGSVSLPESPNPITGHHTFVIKPADEPRPRRWRKALAAAVLLAAVAVLFSALLLIGCGAPAARPDSAISQKQLEYLKAANELKQAIDDAVEAWEKCVRACKATGNASYICRSLLCPRM